MVVHKAKGARVNGLIDFTSGWLVANIGHDNPAVMRAVRKAKGWAVLDRWENPGRVKATEALLSTLPAYLSHVQFYNSGSEAIDAALRMAGGNVIAHPRAYHGSTIGAQSIPRREFTEPLSIDAIIMVNTDHGSFTQSASNLATTILVETFHGAWCDWHSADVIGRLCKEQRSGTVIIFDEMQSGFGRTGAWWGFEHYDICPDIIVGGKAMAGGFPMAFVATQPRFKGTNGFESTFSANPLACAACVATIKEIRTRKLIEHVRELEPLITDAFPDIRGKGFAYAFDHNDADAVVDRALVEGLMLLHTGRGTIKIAPPLCIRKRDLIRGLEILRSVL